jgi:ABC-type glycerol-3-phosphate transport system substrate-binding protein
MFRKMVSISLALCLLLALSATALADWTTEPVTLTIVHEHTPETAVTVASSRMFLKVCDDFLAAYPNVKLDVTAYGAGEIWEKLSVLAAANDLADIVYMNSSVFRSIVGDGMLLDITDTLDPSLFRDNLTTFAADGKVYGVPTKATTYNYMFYNPEIWSKAGYETIPTTWDEFIAACEKVRALG